MAKKSKQNKPKKGWGFDVRTIDPHVRPQDDFYEYANGGWLKKNKIPANESRWGSFLILRYETDRQLRTILKVVLSNKKASTGSPEQLVRDLYTAAVDMKTRNKLGAAPLQPLLERVRGIQNKKELLDTIAYLHVRGVSGGWGAFVDQDSKNSTRYLLHMWQGGLSLPDRDYYLLDKPEQKRIRAAYLLHIDRLLALAGFSRPEAADVRESVLAVETKLAEASMKKEDIRDPHKIYHKMSVVQLQKLSTEVDWANYFKRTYAPGVRELIVGQPEFFAALSKLIRDIPLEDWKRYLEWHIVDGMASSLSDTWVRANFEFIKVVSGQKRLRPLWRRALGATGYVSEALGKLYVEKYFPPSAKRAMDDLVTDLFDVYEERIKKLPWMSPATKRAAIKKLRAMNRKIGYPKKWESYKGLIVKAGDHTGNILRAEEWWHRKQMRKLRKGVDRHEWFMSPQTVNAYFAPNLNDIVFPAAILQWPFFDAKADAAINYAGIGSVIGHEMTHGFDDQGSKFDEKGNMRLWWTAQDRKRFETRAKLLVKQYNRFKVHDGVTVNGTLTLGENIADFGGLSIGWDAYQKHLRKVGRTTIHGLSPEMRFFLGYAQVERELETAEFAKMSALTDPHSPAQYRINGPLSNFKPFYDTFKLKKGDKLYRIPKDRAQIW